MVAIGQGSSFFTLQLKDGKLKVHSSMLAELEGVTMGNNLNDTNWQKVDLEFNGQDLVMTLNNKFTATNPINPEGAAQTAFNMTYLGGTPVNSSARFLVSSQNPYEPFIGCIQDIVVNGVKVTEKTVLEDGIRKDNIERGCTRSDQCNPNPCLNEGKCLDLWRTHQCQCERPHLGPNCQYNYTGATFGYENITNSQAVVSIANPNDYKYNIDLTMFIRTRQPSGIVFYLGKRELQSPVKNYIIGRLVNGTLNVEISKSDLDHRDPLKLTAQLSDGNRHFIRVKWVQDKILISVNESIFINQVLSLTTPIQAEKLYLGNRYLMEPVVQEPVQTISTTSTSTTTTTTTLPTTTTAESVTETVITDAGADQTTLQNIEAETEAAVVDDVDTTTPVSAPLLSRPTRDVEDNHDFFKGVIQDVRLGNERVTRIVNLYQLEYSAAEQSLGEVKNVSIKAGEVSDDTCRENPCQNGGECHVTWNDYFCECKAGYKVIASLKSIN